MSQDDFVIPASLTKTANIGRISDDSKKFLKFIDDNIIGKGVSMFGPFGRRKGKNMQIYFFIV